MHILRAVPVLTSGVHKLCMALLLSIQNAVILLCDRKCRDRSGAAMSSAAANEDKPKRCSHRHKGKKKAAYHWKASGRQESPPGSPHLPCQPLNEGWERVNPGSSPSGLSAPLHTPALPWAGRAFPPGAPSLLQATT